MKDSLNDMIHPVTLYDYFNRYGGSSRTASSYYGGSFGGSQDLIDMYGHETDSVFTDEDAGGDHISFRGSHAGGSVGIGKTYRYDGLLWTSSKIEVVVFMHFRPSFKNY